MKLSISNIFLLVFSGLILAFCVFYLGARFGPEMFWGINLSEIEHNTLLPAELQEQELQALLKSDSPEMNFHQVLAGKVVKEEITGEVNGPILEAKPIEVKSPVIAEVPVAKPDKTMKVVVEQSAKESSLVSEVKVPEASLPRVPGPKEPQKSEGQEMRKEVQREKLSASKLAVVAKPAALPVVPTPSLNTPAPNKPELNEVVAQSRSLFSLQIGSFQEATSAQELVRQYQARGYSPKIKTLELPSKGTWYKVYIGSYSNREEADSARADVAAKYKGAPLIVQVQ